MTGKRPPKFVRGYNLDSLTDDQVTKLQDWAVNKVAPTWLTGIGLLDAAEMQVEEAVSNGNIPLEADEENPQKLVGIIQRKLDRAKRQYHKLLTVLDAAVTEAAEHRFEQQHKGT